MQGDNRTNFSYLNRDGEWPGFRRAGLELLKDGALSLYSLPLLETVLPVELQNAKDPSGPSGIAIAPDGTVFYSDTSHNRIWKIDWCDKSVNRLSCIGGGGSDPVRLNKPRGLFIPRHRRALHVADSGNNRIQVFDLESLQLVDILGQRQPAVDTNPGSEPGQLDTPWGLDGDAEGNLLVVDYGNQRVQKFNRTGDVVPSFWESMRQSGTLVSPSAIAISECERETLIYVLDDVKRQVFVFDALGNAIRNGDGTPVSFGSGLFERPMGLAASSDSVFVGNNQHRRVLVFNRADGYEFAGEAVGYQGPVAALAVRGRDSLLVHGGTELAPSVLRLRSGYRSSGVLWSGAIQVREYEVGWHRLQAMSTKIGQAGHIRLFVHTSSDRTDRPAVNPESIDPFSDPRWRPASVGAVSDIEDLFIDGDPSLFLWVGAALSGDGRSTPVVTQLKVEFDHQTYLKNLPAIYREDSPCGEFLTRFVSLFETFFNGTESEIEDLARLFDPEVAPAEFLDWLAGWLAIDLDDEWDDQKKRRAITTAFEMYNRRGTARGLSETLRFVLDVDATIEEPILQAELWALPSPPASCGCNKRANVEDSWSEVENSILGVTTMLAPAHPQGAVVGSTATLDQSHLISNEELGSPLFMDVAHRFTVQVFRGQLNCDKTLNRIRDLIDREKPAHTDYHLCIVEPQMRVGYQARVGIDAVVGGPSIPTAIGDTRGAVLGGQQPARIGETSLLGLTTRVG